MAYRLSRCGADLIVQAPPKFFDVTVSVLFGFELCCTHHINNTINLQTHTSVASHSAPSTMARQRKKKRTHVGAHNPPNPAAVNGHANPRDPKSMVIRIGASEVGTSVSQLASDVRKVMEPGTASRLKERKANRLRDYVTMCGPLGVTHLLLFSRSSSGNTNLRLAIAPRGPTFHFRVERYSLAKDVKRAQRRPKGGGKEFLTPPLVRRPACPRSSSHNPLTFCFSSS